MTDLTLYHNPRCSKSRGALELLEARGLTPTVVRYLETPLSAAQLRDLLAKLDGNDELDDLLESVVQSTEDLRTVQSQAKAEQGAPADAPACAAGSGPAPAPRGAWPGCHRH